MTVQFVFRAGRAGASTAAGAEGDTAGATAAASRITLRADRIAFWRGDEAIGDDLLVALAAFGGVRAQHAHRVAIGVSRAYGVSGDYSGPIRVLAVLIVDELDVEIGDITDTR